MIFKNNSQIFTVLMTCVVIKSALNDYKEKLLINFASLNNY